MTQCLQFVILLCILYSAINRCFERSIHVLGVWNGDPGLRSGNETRAEGGPAIPISSDVQRLMKSSFNKLTRTYIPVYATVILKYVFHEAHVVGPPLMYM